MTILVTKAFFIEYKVVLQLPKDIFIYVHVLWPKEYCNPGRPLYNILRLYNIRISFVTNIFSLFVVLSSYCTAGFYEVLREYLYILEETAQRQIKLRNY